MLTKQKGDVAIGQAISHYLATGYEVCLPIGDKRHYDLLIERDGCVSRVQVKYAGLYPSRKVCRAALRITGGNQSFGYAKKYADDAFDVLFVYTAKGQQYSIPWKEIVPRNEISVEHPKYQRYLLTNKKSWAGTEVDKRG